MTLQVGSRLGSYVIAAPLGAGGMGEVYRAHDPRLGRDVAIKVLAADLSASAEVQQRFEREARTISQLNHPHICTLYDIGRQDGTDYLVLELLEGETLASRLEKGPLPLPDVLRYGIEIASALDAAHRAGIVHRDLKPGNVMLTRSGAKLMDFGLARGVEPTGVGAVAMESPTVSRPLTAEGTIVGTLHYMAPEQLEGKETDARTDVWALGCVLYEMTTGRRAFDGDSQASLVAAIMDREPPEVARLQPTLPPTLDHIVKRCLAKEPADRWQSARDVMHELQWIAATATQTVTQPTARVRVRERRGTLQSLAIWLLGIAIGAAAAVAVMTHQAGSLVVAFTPKTFQPYPIFNARFAPDGESIVFSAAPEGNTPELYSVRPEYIAPRPLGLRQTHLLAVSPIGEMAVLTGARHIAHCVFQGTLARLALGAEAPRELLENVRDADWNPDGSGLAIIREVGGRDRLEYPIGRVLCESGGYLSDVRFSPRGDRIAFFDHPYKWDDRGSIKVTDLSGRVTELSSGYSAEEGIAWSPDGAQVYFSGADSTISASIFAVTLSGRRRVAQESAVALIIHDVSRRGRWLVTRDDIRVKLMARPPGATSERDLSWLENSEQPALSADGRTIAFSEAGGEHNVNYQVCLRGTDGSPVMQLGEGAAGELSPNGNRVLAFVATTPMRAMLYPTGAGEPVKLERGNIEAYDGASAWFPDGRRIAFCGTEPGKGSRVYVQDVPKGQPRAVTPEGTNFGALSPDGMLVLARGSDGLWAIYPVEGGTRRPAPGLTARDEIARWSKDGRSVYAYDPRQIPCQVDRVDLASGRRDSVMLLGTENRTGLCRVVKVSMADDPRVYAYAQYHTLSTLFIVDGAR